MSTAGGHVAPGYEPVVKTLEDLVATGGETGLGVAACVRGEPVVDAWCGTANGGSPWDRDTLAVVFSCTKGATALCAHILVDRGLLDPEEHVTAYWPEYGANGKGGTLVKHFLNHSAGVLSFPRYWEVIGDDGHGLADTAAITERLAAAAPHWTPGTVVLYHALSYGWLVGELVRRIDGRTVGRFFAEEVAAPLGLEMWIGLPAEHNGRVASPIPVPAEQDPDKRRQSEEMVRRCCKALREDDLSSLEALWYASLFLPVDADLAVGDGSRFVARALDDPVIRAAEVPAGNGIANAGSLARMYAPLSVGGTLDGARLVSPESITRVSTHQLLTFGGPTGFGLGYALMAPEMCAKGPTEKAFGHSGAGGNLGFADPGHQVSFGLVKNQMRGDNAAAEALVSALYSCL